MDAFVRQYIHENLSFRFMMVPDGAAAFALEASIKSGTWGTWPPPLKSREVTNRWGKSKIC